MIVVLFTFRIEFWYVIKWSRHQSLIDMLTRFQFFFFFSVLVFVRLLFTHCISVGCLNSLIMVGVEVS